MLAIYFIKETITSGSTLQIQQQIWDYFKQTSLIGVDFVLIKIKWL